MPYPTCRGQTLKDTDLAGLSSDGSEVASVWGRYARFSQAGFWITSMVYTRKLNPDAEEGVNMASSY
ncbi:MAG: hypothetical protein WCC85_16830, partial [Candidatus Sulfotelmatobacter sp.]